MTAFSLHPFPGQDSGGVTIQGGIERTDQTMALSFLLQGNLGDLVLPIAAAQNGATISGKPPALRCSGRKKERKATGN